MRKIFFIPTYTLIIITSFSTMAASAKIIVEKNLDSNTNLIATENHTSPFINNDLSRNKKIFLQKESIRLVENINSKSFDKSEEISKRELFGQNSLDFFTPKLAKSTTGHSANENLDNNVKGEDLDRSVRHNRSLTPISSERLSYLESRNLDSFNNKNSQIAQVSTPFTDKQPLGWSQRDIAAPGSLAGKLIGASTSKIPNISTPGALATQLLTGFNSDGKFATGLGIDTVPYLLLRGSGMTLEEYRKDSFKRFLSNTSVSIATNRETSGDVARVGISAQFTLINEGDRRMSDGYLTKLEGFAATITQDPKFIGLPQDQINVEVGKRLAEFKKNEWYANEVNRLAAKPMWTAGIGTSLITSTGRYSDLRGDGMGLWTTYRQGIGGDAQLILHGAYRSGERIADLNGGFFNGDTLVLGTRIRIGDETDSKYSLEAAYNNESKQGSTSNNYLSFGVGLEQKVLENLWLSLSFTVDPGRQNGADSRFNSGFKWEFGPAGI